MGARFRPTEVQQAPERSSSVTTATTELTAAPVSAEAGGRDPSRTALAYR
ncbi:hypothetical protein ACFZC5_30570 [Nocardia gamkensis]